MNLCEFREHCYRRTPRSFIMVTLQWDCLILKLPFSKGQEKNNNKKKIEAAPVL